MKFTTQKLKDCGYFWETGGPKHDFLLYTPKKGVMAVTIETEEVNAQAIEGIGVLTDENVIRVFTMNGGYIDYPVDDEIEVTMLRAVWEEIKE